MTGDTTQDANSSEAEKAAAAAAEAATKKEPTPEEKIAQEKREHSERVQKRINSEVGRRKQAEAARHQAELVAAEAKGRADALEAARQTPAPAAPEITMPGDRSDYETDDQWLTAHKAYDAHQIKEGMRKEFREQQDESAQKAEADRNERAEAEKKAATERTFSESINEAREKYDDFDTVTTDETLPVTTDMMEVISSSDNAGEVAYHLAKNPTEAERISKLAPIEVAREIGKIEVRLAESPKKKTTSAPDPLSPLNDGGEIPAKDYDKMSQAEYEKARGFG